MLELRIQSSGSSQIGDLKDILQATGSMLYVVIKEITLSILVF